MNEKEIVIVHKIKKENLNCIICLEFIHPPIYQCNSALHFVCPACLAKLKSDSCPSCRDNNLFKNKLLERNLKEYLIDCPHYLCKKSIFKWELMNHVDTCIYAESKCFFCEIIVKPEEFKNHLTTQCEEVEWAERSNKETKGSLGLLSHLSWQCNGFKITNADQLHSNFVVILNKMLLMARREQDKWIIVVISPITIQVDSYFKCFGSKVYEIQSIVTINSFETCKELPELEDMPCIPLDIRKVEFVQSAVENGNDEDLESLASDDVFFRGLLQEPL